MKHYCTTRDIFSFSCWRTVVYVHIQDSPVLYYTVLQTLKKQK